MKYEKLNGKFVRWENGQVSHRPLFKVILNPVLRGIQFWTKKPYVVASLATKQASGLWTINGYTFTRVETNPL